MSIDHISVVIMAKNADATIRECLESLQPFSEVVLYLNDSTDQTETIARTFPNVKIVKGTFTGFGPTKNAAASHAKNEWILSLDSDEILNDALIQEIAAQDFSNTKHLFVLRRENYFLGEKTISKDFLVRIYNKKVTGFNENLVHEKVIVPEDAVLIKLKTGFKHLNVTDINQTLTKLIKYTDLGAEGKQTCFYPVVIMKSTFAFFQSYFLRGYFRDGWVGFTIAVTSANRRFYKYLKQYLHCKGK